MDFPKVSKLESPVVPEQTTTDQSAPSQGDSQQLGFSSNDSIQPGQADGDSALRSEIAGALGVEENDPSVNVELINIQMRQAAGAQIAAATSTEQQIQTGEPVQTGNQTPDSVQIPSDEQIQRNQAIIDAAMKFGRRVENSFQFGGKDLSDWTEFVPGNSGDLGDVYLRIGQDITEHGFFGDSTTRTTKYFGEGGQQLGLVESKIEDGKETITKVLESVPGSIALSPGDTRTVPDAIDTGAGKAASSWDPQQDGKYGATGGGGSSTTFGGTGSTTGSTSSTAGSTSNTTGADAYSIPRSSTGASSGTTQNSDPVTSEATGRVFSQTTDSGTQWDGNSGTTSERTTATSTEYKNSDGTYTYQTETTTTTTDENGNQTSTTTTSTETTDEPKDGYYAEDTPAADATDIPPAGWKLDRSGGVTDGVNPNDLQTEEEPPTLNLPPREDGGVSDYANPRFAGVIDTTEEGSEGMATDGALSNPYNIATPETRPELESDPPDGPNTPNVDPYANKG
jgi:hypothetical protein